MGFFASIDPGPAIGSALASVDPGPAIGNIGVQIDKAVNDVVPGGWLTVGAAALMIAAPYAAPYLAEAGSGFVGLDAATATQLGLSGGSGLSITGGAPSLLSAMGTGALTGGGLGGISSAIQGKDPLKGALTGAILGGLTGGSLNSLSRLGVNPTLARTIVSATRGLTSGADPIELLKGTALSTGLGELGKTANQYVSPFVTNPALGAIGSAIQGGDPLQGAASGAAGTAINTAYRNLFAPSTTAAPIIDRSEPYSPTSVALGGMQQPVSYDLASQYLTEQANYINQQLGQYYPTLSQQQAELQDLMDKYEMYSVDYDEKASALDTAIKGTYMPAYENVVDLQNKAQELYGRISPIQEIYDTNKAAYEADPNNTAAYEAANNAAAQLNELIPQYNEAYTTFDDANKYLTALFESDIAPLYDAAQTSQETLDTYKTQYAALEKDYFNTVEKVTPYVKGLTDISQGKLASGFDVPDLAYVAPTGTTGAEPYYLSSTGVISDAPVGTVVDSNGNATNNLENAYVVTDGGKLVSLDEYTSAIQSGSPIAIDGMMPVKDYETALTDTKYFDKLTGTWKPIPTETGGGGSGTSSEVTGTPPTTPLTKDELDAALANKEITQDEYNAYMSSLGGGTDTGSITDTDIISQLIGGGTGTTGSGTGSGTTGGGTTSGAAGSGTTTAPTDTTTTGTGTTGTTTTGTTPTETPGPSTGTGGTTTAPTPVSQITNSDGSTTITYSDGSQTTTGGTTTGSTETTGGATTGGTETAGGTGTETTGGTTTGGTGTSTGGTGTGGTGTGGTGAGGTGTGGGAGGTGTAAITIPAMLAAMQAAGLGSRPVITAAPGAGEIRDLTPGLTKGSAFQFANAPEFSTEQMNPVQQTAAIKYDEPEYATGGSVSSNNTLDILKAGLVQGNAFSFANKPEFKPVMNPVQQVQPAEMPAYAAGSSVEMPEEASPMLRAALLRGRQYNPFTRHQGMRFAGFQQREFAEGGSTGHNPQFFSEGGLNSLQNTYVKGEGDGTSDSIPAMLADGEFVIPADVVSSLGNGSNDSGAKVLDEFLRTIRQHKRRADAKELPPDSKGALGYLLEAKQKAR